MDRVIKRVLITGATGSGARYLIDWLRTQQPQVEIHGTARRKHNKKAPAGVTLHEADLLDTGSLFRCIHPLDPDVIFHMAGNPDKGFEVPSAILTNNAIGTCNLFEAVRLQIHDDRFLKYPVIINVSSSEVYGDVRPDEVPITEDCPKRPVSPYGVAKLAQDNLGSVYFKAYGLPIITTRAFTYVNLLRPDLFTSAFARQIARIEQGKQTVLRHGNLDSVRVMLDTESIMEAYWLAATKGVAGEAYNLGGDQQVTVRSVLHKLIGLSSVIGIRTEPDPALMRPVDVTLQVPDSSKFRQATGWAPTFDLDASLRKLLDYWRQEVHYES